MRNRPDGNVVLLRLHRHVSDRQWISEVRTPSFGPPRTEVRSRLINEFKAGATNLDRIIKQPDAGHGDVIHRPSPNDARGLLRLTKVVVLLGIEMTPLSEF